MSLRFEQYRALVYTRRFLRDILNKKKMTQKELREHANYCLHHFPFLKENGEPMFSRDEFPCPDIPEEPR